MHNSGAFENDVITNLNGRLWVALIVITALSMASFQNSGVRMSCSSVLLLRACYWISMQLQSWMGSSTTHGSWENASTFVDLKKFWRKRRIVFFLKGLFIYIDGCFVWMQICTPEEGIGSHWTTDIDGCESTCGSWDLNSGPLREQPVYS